MNTKSQISKSIFITLASLVVLMTSCNSNKTPEVTMNRIPFGLEYYMSEDQCAYILDSLVRDSVLFIKPYGSDYCCKLANGLNCSVQLSFQNDSLYRVRIADDYLSGKGTLADFQAFVTGQGINLKAFSKSKSGEDLKYSGDIDEINFYPTLFVICFDEKEIANKIASARAREIIDDYYANGGASTKVENSAWDGSVRQVKNYLKQNLKDWSSYESVEWSPVEVTSNGYVVRHKYRAKNSFGGYVMENQIFFLDKAGNVVSVQ